MTKKRVRFNIRTVRFNEDLKHCSNFKISMKPRWDDIISFLPDDVSDSTFITALAVKSREMCGSELTSLCYKCVKRNYTSAEFWFLVYTRLAEIKDSILITDFIYMFYAYCNSESFDILFDDYIILFWEVLDGKIEKLSFLTLLYVYDCAERTENTQKVKEVKDLILHILNDEKWENIQIPEDRLKILLKLLCKTEKHISDRCKKWIRDEIKRSDFKNIKNIIYCIHFLLKYNIYDDTFKGLLNKAHFYLSFSNSDKDSNVKDLSDVLKFKDPFVVREITRTLYIIYSSLKKNYRS